MKDELLVPLMCGATNVRMNSNQLNNVLIPVPKPTIQDEVIESFLIKSKATAIVDLATSLRESSKDQNVIGFAERVIHDSKMLLKESEHLANIGQFLPS